MIDVTKLIWILLIGSIISGCSNTKVDPCDKSAIIYKSLDGDLNKTICFSSIDSYDLNYKDKPKITIYFPLARRFSKDATVNTAPLISPTH